MLMMLMTIRLCRSQSDVVMCSWSEVVVKMTIQVVCVINLTSTKTREDKTTEQSLEARKAAYAEVEKACAWYVLNCYV